MDFSRRTLKTERNNFFHVTLCNLNYYIMNSKPTIAVSRVDWYGNVHIGLQIQVNYTLIEELKTAFPEIRWSREKRLWHLPYRHNFIGELFQHFKGRYWIDYKAYYKQMDLVKPKTVRPIQALPELDDYRVKLIEQYRKYLSSRATPKTQSKPTAKRCAFFSAFFTTSPSTRSTTMI